MPVVTDDDQSTQSQDSSFLLDLCGYLRDFLDTDFKKERKPKRRISRKDKQNRLTAIPLRKYTKFTSDLWEKLNEPVNTGFELTVIRNRYTVPLDRALSDFITKKINAFDSDSLGRLADKALKKPQLDVAGIELDSTEILIQDVLSYIEALIKREVVTPLLNALSEHLKGDSVQGLNDIYDTEEEIVQILLGQSEESITAALNTAAVEERFDEYEAVINDLFDEGNVKDKLQSYFDTFNSSDIFNELLEILNTVKQVENFQVYLYLTDITLDGTRYPLFYLPVSIAHLEDKLVLEGSPHIYTNKKVVDYVAQQVAAAENKKIASIVKERIMYLYPQESVTAVIQQLLDKWSHDLDIRPPLDLNNTRPQKSQSLLTTTTNNLTIAAFEKSEEALLNDYEELLSLAEENSQVFMDFATIVSGFLYDNPQSFMIPVEDEWAETPMEDRLVFESPVPLNEEQRKLLGAIHKNGCRFIAVQGPPGTGKSHTITAIAFETILKGKSILVLSDKTEALDVVEDKLTSTLNSVRSDENFQNPLLRLGKASNTYNKILSGSSIQQIKQNYLIARGKQEELRLEIYKKRTGLKGQLQKAREKAGDIDLNEVYEFNQLEEEVLKISSKIESYVFDEEFMQGMQTLKELRELLTEKYSGFIDALKASLPFADMNMLYGALDVQRTIHKLRDDPTFTSQNFDQFNSFVQDQLNTLSDFIIRYHEARWPIFGYLFVEGKMRVMNTQFGQKFDATNTMNLHHRVNLLEDAHGNIAKLTQLVTRANQHQYFKLAYQLLADNIDMAMDDVVKLQKLVKQSKSFIEVYPELCEKLNIKSENVCQWLNIDKTTDNTFYTIQKYAKCQKIIQKKFDDIPEIDYTGDKAELESLHTRKLANIIDERVVNFYENHRTLSKSLKSIISNKQKFPQEEFAHIKSAFPCIIANIRDYAEYVPLEKEVFDIVIIDEASQVSIAQAFPAMIRAKKIVVMGDQHQFSNVKTSQASKDINTTYLNQIKTNFLTNAEVGQINTNVMSRLEHFDIKTSILTFIDAMANYTTMLRKHFRGYPELISFSSGYFYNKQLQAVKLRGKAIEEVLEFIEVEQDDKETLRGNANELEYMAIEQTLLDLIEEDEPMSVGIITPFRDQQAYISKMLNSHEYSKKFEELLHIKVMTFDSCQGEERDIIMYSMVANEFKDRLWAIFPKDIRAAGDVEEVLRLQRLNVGFSRAKEKIQFYISMPISSFKGAIGEALRHYEQVLKFAHNMPEASQVDANSPMEAKLLSWFQQTDFAKDMNEYIELIPQFPIGDYLKQLDATYTHPSYRVDFLLRVYEGDNIYNIIIEYDGFKEHFTDLEMVTKENYKQYYKAEDIEREKVLESYGYHMIRVNRFNLGKDPVKTLSKRLYNHIEHLTNISGSNAVIDEINQLNTAMNNGEAKKCPKCGVVQKKEEFYDTSLKSKYGRHCKSCKR